MGVNSRSQFVFETVYDPKHFAATGGTARRFSWTLQDTSRLQFGMTLAPQARQMPMTRSFVLREFLTEGVLHGKYQSHSRLLL